MAGLQRFIAYIYYYENEERKQNTGFAKIEIRGNSCRMEVHIRGLLIDKPEGTVYLFARKEKIMQGIPVGNINVQRGNGDVGYIFDTKELENYGVTIGQIEGIMIPLREGSYIASQWKEGEIRESFFRILDKNEPKETVEPKKTEPDAAEPKTAEPDTAEPKIAEQETSKPETSRQKVPEQEETVQETIQQRERVIQQENIRALEMASQGQDVEDDKNQEEKENQEEKSVHATEVPLEKLFDDVGWERYFMKLKSNLPICFPFEGEQIECVQMELKDIRELPKKYWYLGNNSFLLHGFFNYRHLLMGETEGEDGKEYFIGIPGVFQNQERIMATMFGFPEFRAQKSKEHKTGEFGYWYRII